VVSNSAVTVLPTWYIDLIEVEVDFTPKSIGAGIGTGVILVQAAKNKTDINVSFFMLEVIVAC
jgi:hypothetical protein